MKIEIKIENGKTWINLIQKSKEIDSLEISSERKIFEELLPKIDILLKRNKLKPKDIVKILVKSDQGENFTTTRIAKTVAKVWNFCAL